MSFLSKMQAIIAAIEGETLPVDRQMVGMSTPFHIDSSGAVVMAAPSLSVTLDASGNPMPGLDSLSQTLAYAGGFLATITATDGVSTWVQTYGNDGTNVTTISRWVKQ
jgi:hypothetical protein